MSDRLRSYEVARKFFSFCEFVSWSIVVLGLLAGIIMAQSVSRFGAGIEQFLFFAIGCGISLFGLYWVGTIQYWRASVDSAEYSQQSLKVSRESLEISKQSLRMKQHEPHTFAALREETGGQHTVSFKRQSVETDVAASSVTGQEMYRGVSIRLFGDAYRTMGGAYETLEAAKDAIDASQQASKPADESVRPQPETIYRGISIKHAAGGFRAKGIYFDTLDEMKRALDKMLDTKSIEKQTAPQETLETQETARETVPVAAFSPHQLPNGVTQIGEKFVVGQMEFSSLEAAKNYAKQLGVNPKFDS